MIEVSVTEIMIIRSVGREIFIIWRSSMVLLKGGDMSEVTW